MSYYTLYLDKSEDFICEIQIKNASLKNSIARLLVETSDGPTLVFNGLLNENKCIIPIKRLKGILNENDRGTIRLEIIVEDTYFSPWKSDFLIEEHTSVKVRVNEQKQHSSNKPTIKIKNPIIKCGNNIKKENINLSIPKKEISVLFERFGIRKNNFHKKKNDLIQILKEYFKLNKEYNYYSKSIIRGIRQLLR